MADRIGVILCRVDALLARVPDLERQAWEATLSRLERELASEARMLTLRNPTPGEAVLAASRRRVTELESEIAEVREALSR